MFQTTNQLYIYIQAIITLVPLPCHVSIYLYATTKKLGVPLRFSDHQDQGSHVLEEGTTQIIATLGYFRFDHDKY